MFKFRFPKCKTDFTKEMEEMTKACKEERARNKAKNKSSKYVSFHDTLTEQARLAAEKSEADRQELLSCIKLIAARLEELTDVLRSAPDAPEAPDEPDQEEYTSDDIGHPSHYNYAKYEVREVINAFQLSYDLGNVVKYVLRHRHKGTPLKDLKKARQYLDFVIKDAEENPAYFDETAL